MDVHCIYRCIVSRSCMKMHYAATILFTVLHVHLRVSALDHTDVLAALQQACPYTNFCNKNASSYIQDGRQAPCCRECSCNDDCWKRGNCCPDKIVRDKGLAYEHETCKDTQVSSAGAATANGLSQFRRYFVTETCPETVEDDFVKEKCTGIVTETLTDLLWVSDPDTNRIYRNKFCAECHGIRKYQEWQISTNCLNLLLMENYTQNIRAYPDCRLSVIPPNTKAYDNQCLVPDISTCNETGLWQTKDSTTESLCNSHSLMFVKQFLLRSIVYRNVFCFKCNSPAGTTVEDICDSSEVGGKRTFDSFTAILNIFEADDTLLEERRCGMDEVEDPLKRICLKLFCPVTQFPRYGSCQSRYYYTYFLMIGIRFRLRTNFSRLRYGTRDGADYNDIGLGVAIRRQVYHALGLNQCGRCIGKFYQSNLNEKVGNSKLSLYYDFQATIFTHDSRCSDEMIVAAMSNIIGEELIVYLEEDEYITLDVGEVENDSELEMNASQIRLPAAKDDQFCLKGAYLSFRDLNKCPMVRLDDAYYPFLMRLADTAAKTRLVKTLFAMNGGREELSARINITSVCWEDYRTLVSRVTNLSLKHAGNTCWFIMISFVIILLD